MPLEASEVVVVVVEPRQEGILPHDVQPRVSSGLGAACAVSGRTQAGIQSRDLGVLADRPSSDPVGGIQDSGAIRRRAVRDQPDVRPQTEHPPQFCFQQTRARPRRSHAVAGARRVKAGSAQRQRNLEAFLDSRRGGGLDPLEVLKLALPAPVLRKRKLEIQVGDSCQVRGSLGDRRGFVLSGADFLASTLGPPRTLGVQQRLPQRDLSNRGIRAQNALRNAGGGAQAGSPVQLRGTLGTDERQRVGRAFDR